MGKNTTWIQLFFVIIAMSIFTFGCAQKRGKFYSIARDPTWSPLDFEQNQGDINNYLVSTLLRAGKEKKFRFRLLDVGSAQLLFGLENEEYDAVLSTITPNKILEKRFDFSKPFLALGPVLIVNKDSGIRGMKDLEGKIIGVTLSSDNTTLIAQSVQDSIIRNYISMPEALEALQKKELDGVLMRVIEAKQLVGSLYKNSLEIATEPLNQDGIRLVVLQGKNEDLLKKINASLTQKND
jgi:polar amino acid transport system substrate-binding protein